MTINKGLKQSTTVEDMIINFLPNLFLQTSSKKTCNFLIFCPILTNFLPKCRAQNVDSEKRAWRWEKGHGAGEKGHGAAP